MFALAYTVCSLILSGLPTFKLGEISQKILDFPGGKWHLKILSPNSQIAQKQRTAIPPHWLGQGTNPSTLSQLLLPRLVSPELSWWADAVFHPQVPGPLAWRRGGPFGLMSLQCVVPAIMSTISKMKIHKRVGENCRCSPSALLNSILKLMKIDPFFLSAFWSCVKTEVRTPDGTPALVRCGTGGDHACESGPQTNEYVKQQM